MIVTDRRIARDLPAQLDAMLAALEPGVAIVQVREKDLGGAALYALTLEIVEIARRYQTRVLVNDRLDVALAAGADGVHLPEHGMAIADVRAIAGPDYPISCSRHSIEGVRQADRDGAHAVVFGPIYPTPSKAAYGTPIGVAALAAAKDPQWTGAMLVAIGGIDTPARAAECRAAGADGVAAIRALWTADDPGAAARALVSAG